jgi:glycerol-3-phosphate dehydrogenase (NAD(P)+)
MNMVAEGYNASKFMLEMNKKYLAEMPIAETIYKILWEKISAEDGFKYIEENLI